MSGVVIIIIIIISSSSSSNSSISSSSSLLRKLTQDLKACREVIFAFSQFLSMNLQLPLSSRVYKETCKCDVWLTVHRNSVWIRKTN